ncbi:hypothetical protein JKF63_05442 [Porcisia hertigi]|uniref:Uncharacterized protein n=1 Tax=Porcisia hertigi TaxID=2761500 RepID=A0A836ILG1_9TRYP|nr:hypothetical protein JKF63_05442 [Porcisia hertigi]
MPPVSDVCDALGTRAVLNTFHHLGRHLSPGICGDVEDSGQQDACHCRPIHSSVSLPAAVSPGRGSSPLIERYLENTYSSQRRADGSSVQLDYLHRGTGRGCTSVSPYNGRRGGDGEESGVVFDSGDAAFLSASFSKRAPAGSARRAGVPDHHYTSTGRSPHVRRTTSPHPCNDMGCGGEHGRRNSQRSASSPSFDNVPHHPSDYVPQTRSRHGTSSDHHSQKGSLAVDGDRRHGTRMPPRHNARGAGESSPSDRPPLLPSVASATPLASFVGGPSSNAIPHSQTFSSVEAPLHHSTHGDSAQQPLAHNAPLPSRARDSLADLVAKIRAEISKETTACATGSPISDVMHNPADVRRPVTTEENTKMRSRPEKPQGQGYSPGMTSHAEQTSTSHTTASTRLSSPTTSTGAEGASPSHVVSHRRSTSADTKGGSHAYRAPAAPPEASAQDRSAPSPRRRGTPREDSGPTRQQLFLSPSSSSVDLHSAVRKAETVLRHLQSRRPHRHNGSCTQSPFAEKTKGLMGSSLPDDATAVGLRQQILAHGLRHRKRRGGSHGRRAHRGHSAPSLHFRPHATRVSPRRSSSASIPTGISRESQSTPQRAHAPDGAAGAAVKEVKRRSGNELPVTQARTDADQHQQERWHTMQERRIERLREGLSSLCAAVRKDLRKVREEVERARAEANVQADDIRREMRQALTATLHSNSPSGGAVDARRREAEPHPSSVLDAVSQCTPEDQRRLAVLFLPHLRPLLTEVVQEEVQRLLREHCSDQQEALHALEQRLHARVAEVALSHQRQARVDETRGGDGISTAPASAHFSSAEALDAHLRSTARAVLLEEDDRRYSLASENERRHERRVRQLQQGWEETLSTAQAQWKAELKTILEEEENVWIRRARAPLQQHADVLQEIVKALTRDVTRLQEQQEVCSTRLSTSIRQEREMRVQEQTQLTERVEQRVRQLLPREVESACVRFHALREQRLAAAVPRSAVSGPTASVSPHLSAIHTSSFATVAAAPSAEELRLSIVQPTMEHMRRLLVAHQEMVDATVEDRCRRAEHTVEGSRHVWSQNVAELRAKFSALRADVRGAFGELCENLKVAAPAM